MSFWGCAVKPGQKHKVAVPDSDLLHVSQVCLHEPGSGKNYLRVDVDGKSFTVACLEKDKVEHVAVDLFFTPKELVFSSSGKSEIHLMGYYEPTEDGEEEAPVAAKKTASPKVSPKASLPSSPSAKAKAMASQAKDESESDLEDEEEEEDMLDDEEDEEEEPTKAVPAQSPKRQAAEALAGSAAKKAKADTTPAGDGDDQAKAAFMQLLLDYVKKNGPSKLGDIGTKVQRPANVPKGVKLKAIFEANKDKFVISGETVSAKK